MKPRGRRRPAWWLVRASIARARGRSLWSLASLALVGALVASLLGIRARVTERASLELARFGPNAFLVAADPAASGLPASWLPSADALAHMGVESAVVLWRQGSGEPAVLCAAPLEGALPSWASPGADASALGEAETVVACPLDSATEWQSVAVRVRPADLDGFVTSSATAWPGVAPRVVQGVALAEARVLRRTGAFVAGVSAVLVALSALCLASTLMAQWMERRREVGLLLALGGTRARIGSIFAVEVALLATCGGAAGAVAGSVLGWCILRMSFSWEGSVTAWPWWTLAAGTLAALLVGAAGSALPLARILRAEPVDALRAR